MGLNLTLKETHGYLTQSQWGYCVYAETQYHHTDIVQFTRIHTCAYNTVRIATYLLVNIPEQKISSSRDLKPPLPHLTHCLPGLGSKTQVSQYHTPVTKRTRGVVSQIHMGIYTLNKTKQSKTKQSKHELSTIGSTEAEPQEMLETPATVLFCFIECVCVALFY